MPEYREKSKDLIRKESLGKAVKLLTKERARLPLADKFYVRRVHEHLLKSNNPYDSQMAACLSNQTIESWENFYDGLLSQKTPSDLKIAYLSGPNPENDLDELVSLGILPENVWAFESNNRTYDAAVKSALESKFPFIKIFNGDIGAFLSLAPIRFDLVYLDFCGPILSPSKSSKNLATLFTLFQRHALNSPGIVISNAAFPNEEQDPTGWGHLVKLISCYLYPKEFVECNEGGSFIEGPIAHGNSPEEFTDIVRSNSEFYYGQFLTRINMDIASFIAPYQTFAATPQVKNKFFRNGDKSLFEDTLNSFYHSQEDGSGGNVGCDANQYPLMWTIAALYSKRRDSDPEYPAFVDEDPKFAEYTRRFLRQLAFSKQESEMVKMLETTLFLLSEDDSVKQFYGDSLSKICSRNWAREMYPFCDYVLAHQLKELLIRQVSVPFHFNVEKCRRWTYKAKEHQMFVDLSVFDEARYVYDWMPTMDMLENGMDNTERQLAFRFALDALNKHRRWYNPEFFSGTAIIDQFTSPFEAKELSKRLVIEDQLQDRGLTAARDSIFGRLFLFIRRIFKALVVRP